MEGTKKGMSPILMAVLVLVGSCLLAVGLWYGLNYFKGEDKPSDSNTPVEESTSYISNPELELEFSKIHKFAYYYFVSWPYCGESEKVNGDETLKVSKQFKTYNELLSYLNSYMSEEVMNQSRYFKKENYYEKDGKLYCITDAKGWVYEYDSSKVDIVNSTDNKAETKITFKSSNGEEYRLTEFFDVTFEKINDSWIITKYNKTGEGDY